MSKDYCVYKPKRGVSLFESIRKAFNYNDTFRLFTIATHPKFIERNKESLSLDAEGFPSFDSFIATKEMQKLLGEDRLIKSLQSQYKPQDDTTEAFNMLLENAITFNTTSSLNKSFVAYVQRLPENKITVKIVKKDRNAEEYFNNQYSTFKLNKRIVEILQPLNITIGQLEEAESRKGRLGMIDFSKAKTIARDFSSLIKVANNSKGAQAVSEEFSHLMVEVFKDNVLVQRSLDTLSNNSSLLEAILGDQFSTISDFYSGDMRLVAEEALGKILQDNLINETNLDEYKNKSLFKRVMNFIQNKFKGYDSSELERAIIEVDNFMGQIAKDIIKGNLKPTKEEIESIDRTEVFNSLDEEATRNIKLLEEALQIEAKRYKIYKTTENKEKVTTLNAFLAKDAETVKGLLYFIKTGCSELNALYSQYKEFDSLLPHLQYSLLRSTRDYIQSYIPFIKNVKDALLEDADNDRQSLKETIEVGEDGLEISVKSMLRKMGHLCDVLERTFINKAKGSFIEFLKPALPQDFLDKYSKTVGNKASLEALLDKADKDISFFDRYLDSMADSSDVLLQIIDSRVKMNKDKTRRDTIHDIKRVQKWMLDAEKAGITTFEWMFERDSEGNLGSRYISEINYAQFELDYKNFKQQLKEKYGDNPKGKAKENEVREHREWLDTHTTKGFGRIPRIELYRNEDFFNLSETQKELLDRYLYLKSTFDKRYDSPKTDTYKVIQIRKNAVQRIVDASGSINSLFENTKEAIRESLVDKEDDNTIFGETKTGLRSFDGSEFMTLPMLYVNQLDNPNEVSTDVVRSLMCYAYSTNNYYNLEEIINPLEIGRIIINEYREVNETRGGKKLVEKLKANGVNISNDIISKGQNNIVARYNDFLESQVYQRYLKDEGTLGSTSINTNKAVSAVLKYSSAVQLGFNWLANIANITTGISMQNIEAAAREFYTEKDLFKADREYTKFLKDLLADLPNRVKTNRLSLFGELFNIKQDFEKDIKKVQKKNLLGRIFGSSIQFLGQECGDHWLYYRTAIAMCLKTKVIVPEKGEMSLWEALEVTNYFEGREDIKEMRLPKGTTMLDGSEVNLKKIGRQIADVNQHLFGIYNEEDSNAANRLALGRLLMQYRKWMKPQLNKRFMEGQYNVTLDKFQEGYYRTLLRVVRELVRGTYQLRSLKDTLSDVDKANINRSLFEILQFWTVFALARWVDWGDGEDRPWLAKMAEYVAQRSVHELGALSPASPVHFVRENLKTVKTPIPSINLVDNTLKLVESILTYEDHITTLQSGPYEGMTVVEKNLYKAPIPGLSQYRSLDKFFDDTEASIQYYIRTY